MSQALVKSFESDFSPEKFTDDYQDQLKELIAAKLEKGDALDTAETFGEQADGDSGGEVLDLMEALRRSVEKNRAGSAPAAKGSTKKPAAQKTATQKPAAKKTAAKKKASA
jgi:DNA end-binding protein Ku